LKSRRKYTQYEEIFNRRTRQYRCRIRKYKTTTYFKIVDFLAKKENVTFETVKLGALAKYTFKGRTFFLLKPNTYMNLSVKPFNTGWIKKTYH
jgi:peptidyl-tRNA hydrolase